MDICLIEDSEDDAEYINVLLQQMPDHKKKAKVVETIKAAELLLLHNKFDAIILDLNLPDSNGIATFNRVQKLARKTPIIILTGENDYSLGSEAVALGAQDYLSKDNLKLDVLRRSTLYAIERQRSFDALQQLATIVATCTDAVITRNLEGTILTWNKGAEEMYGYTAEEAIGQSGITLLNSQLPLPIPEIIEILRRDDRWQGEFSRQTKDGRKLIVSSRWALSRDDHGEPSLIFDLSNDISERRQQEENLRYLGAIVENSEDAIIGEDLSGKIISWNSGAQQLYGYSAEETIGKNIALLIPKWVDCDLKELYLKQINDQELASVEVEARHKDGRKIDIAQTVSPIKDLQGHLVGVSSISRDITPQKIAAANLISIKEELEKRVAERTAELVALNKELMTARDLAQRASKLKSEFVANMSHEIRTPLNAVIGMANILQKTDLKEEQRSYTSAIQESGQSLLHIVNDILDFSKIEAGKIELELVCFDLVQEVESTCCILAAQAKTKCLSFMSFVDPSLPKMVRGDSGRLRQILTNLLANAIKFSEDGEVAVQILKGPVTGNFVQIECSVSDSGIGLSIEEQARVFEAFEQADGSTSRRFGGSGLGLNIAKNLVEVMHGKLGVTSKLGQGATFWFSVPLEIASELQPETLKPELQDARILIVDDEPHARQFLQNYVTAWGGDSHCLEDAEKAIAVLDKAQKEGAPYQVAIIDATTPTKDCFSLAKEICESPELQDTKLIFLNANDDKQARLIASHIEVTAFLNKPVKQSELLDSLLCVSRNEEQQQYASHKKIREAKDEHQKPTRREKILVAEDNILNQQVMRIYLESLGFSCVIVTNGIQALEAIRAETFDLILMDCQMPLMDGFQAARAIRQTEIHTEKRIPIIATTASAIKGDREDCLKSGMDDYICKPIEQTELVNAMRRWLPEK